MNKANQNPKYIYIKKKKNKGLISDDIRQHFYKNKIKYTSYFSGIHEKSKEYYTSCMMINKQHDPMRLMKIRIYPERSRQLKTNFKDKLRQRGELTTK